MVCCQALHYIDLLLRHGPAPRRSARTPSLPRVIAAPESDVVCVDVEETSGREEEERLWSAGDEVAPAGWGGGGWGYWRGALQWRKVVDMGYAGSTRAALAACEAALAEHSLLQGALHAAAAVLDGSRVSCWCCRAWRRMQA